MNRCLLFVVCFFVSSYSFSANDKAFAWQVTSGDATVYLMGSIHFADKSFYPLRKEIEEAFDHSEYLVVELDINNIDHDTYLRVLTQKGVYKDDTTIRDTISDETWLQLRQRLRYLNIDYGTVKKYKPGILVLTLSAAQVMQMGFDAKLGIDAHFLTKAVVKDHAKKIIELETLEQQLNLFLEIPDGELLLKESLYSLEESELLMLDMVRYWKTGDIKLMNKLLFEDALREYPAFSNIYESLLYSRNANMVSKIDDMLKKESAFNIGYFIVVGTGHLIGEKGIVSALKEKGYEVRRM